LESRLSFVRCAFLGALGTEIERMTNSIDIGEATLRQFFEEFKPREGCVHTRQDTTGRACLLSVALVARAFNPLVQFVEPITELEQSSTRP
jgi:hypothetical protein